MRRIYCEIDDEKLAEIRQELRNGRDVEIHNDYATIHGFLFDKWLRNGLTGISCTINVAFANPWYGFPRIYVASPL